MEIKREYNKVNASHSLRDENPMGDNRFVVFDFRWSLMRKGKSSFNICEILQ